MQQSKSEESKKKEKNNKLIDLHWEINFNVYYLSSENQHKSSHLNVTVKLLILNSRLDFSACSKHCEYYFLFFRIKRRYDFRF